MSFDVVRGCWRTDHQVSTPMPDLGLTTFRPPSERLAQAWNVHREFFVFSDELATTYRSALSLENYES